MSDFPTYVVIQVMSKCSDESLQTVIDELSKPWEDGGGGLYLTLQPPRPNFPESLILVSATNEHIIRIAEHIEVKKKDVDGFIRPITEDDIEQFEESGRVGPLTLSDVQRCILHAINRVHFDVEVTTLPGDGRNILKGAPVLSSYEERHLVNIIPTHDEEDLDKLYRGWKRSYFYSPISQIRDYFGESVALYFSFEGVYTQFLVLVAVLGVVQHILETYAGIDHVSTNVLFTLSIILAVGIYLEVWKRQSNEHSFHWGSMGKLRRKPPRPEYRGELRESPASGKLEMYYPFSKTIKKIVLVSLPVTILCLSLAVTLMLFSFTAEARVMEVMANPETGQPDSDIITTIITSVPSVAYSLSIIIFNSIYLKIARKLTVWENHRTQEQHDTHITLKLVIFEFVNTFLALFYTGIYLQDLKALKSQLFTTLLVQQVVNQFQEVFIPFFLQKPSSVKFVNKVTRKLGIQDKPKVREVQGITVLSESDPQGEQVLKNISGNHLESLHDDFMELWLQFGHVFLFLSVYPLAALLALINNITEMWADRYKLCRLSSKPRPMCIRDIGAWYSAFRLTGMLSIVSNCWLLSLDLYGQPACASLSSSDLQWFLLWVTVEHGLFAIFLGLDALISDVPAKVKLQMDRANLHFKKKVLKDKLD
eukprot:TRINITY_DN3055_c0_g1_i1.p1 TRINITY_DN3055_c0_g1~~TRINITY_DN3055_c0_g1_i1.p1  ORF type:complete len:650 (-),score=118.07 TRINITY_DN3055_c0_g1_i1:446-2395(-)